MWYSRKDCVKDTLVSSQGEIWYIKRTLFVPFIRWTCFKRKQTRSLEWTTEICRSKPREACNPLKCPKTEISTVYKNFQILIQNVVLFKSKTYRNLRDLNFPSLLKNRGPWNAMEWAAISMTCLFSQVTSQKRKKLLGLRKDKTCK